MARARVFHGVGRELAKLKWWLLTLLLSGPLALLITLPDAFRPLPGKAPTQQGAGVSSVGGRPTSARRPNVTVVLDNAPGGLGSAGLTGTFQTNGGSLVILASGSSRTSATAPGSGQALDVVLELDGAPIGHLTASAGGVAPHTVFPSQTFRLGTRVSPDGGLPAPSAGMHRLTMRNGNALTANDSNDHFNATVLEFAP